MDQKNFIVAIVLSVLIIVGWQYFFPPAKTPVTNTVQQQTTSPTGQPRGTASRRSACRAGRHPERLERRVPRRRS